RSPLHHTAPSATYTLSLHDALPISQVFFATPSFAMYLIEKMQERGIYPEQLALRIGSFGGEAGAEVPSTRQRLEEGLGIDAYDLDRKSTRLNSSHVKISYAVFCLKK